MTDDQLIAATGCTAERAALFGPHLREACAAYGINTPERIAAFLAQIGHESGSFKYTTEVWGPTPAQSRYEGRTDLGNTQPGDGERYKGRGLIQTTGRNNYTVTRERLRLRGLSPPDFVAVPDFLAEPKWAAWTAADFWDSRSLNALADAGLFETITRRINGGVNGLENRIARWERAKKALAVQATTPTPVEADPNPASNPKDITMPTPVIPAIAAALWPVFAEKIPELVKLITGTKEERKENVTGLVVDTITKSLNAANAQQAAEMLQADPSAVATARKAVTEAWYDIQEAGGGGIGGARATDLAFVQSHEPLWRSPSFAIACLMLPLVYLVMGNVVGLYGEKLPPDVRSAIINGVVGMILGGLIGYYYGQTTSRNREKAPAA